MTLTRRIRDWLNPPSNRLLRALLHRESQWDVADWRTPEYVVTTRAGAVFGVRFAPKFSAVISADGGETWIDPWGRETSLHLYLRFLSRVLGEYDREREEAVEQQRKRFLRDVVGDAS